MDVFDLPIAPGPEPPRGRDRRENVASGIVVFGLPAIYLAVLTVTDLTKQPGLAVLWLPAAIGALGAVVCVLARMGVGRSLVAAVGCLWWCLVAAVTMVAVDILIFPF
ncbi:MAG TPA: hypothetical protein VHF45_12050 [Thermoleophilaceae bacterium]|nr:hypothetical protein [Thermoleophilaceae bacterium]